MTFLKKLGSVLATVTGLFMGFAPLLTKQYPQTGEVVTTVSKDLAAIGDGVAQIEAIGQLQGLSGEQKAKALGPIVAQIVLSSSLVAGKKIADPALFQQACTNLGGDVADILNSLHEDGVEVVISKPEGLKALPPAPAPAKA